MGNFQNLWIKINLTLCVLIIVSCSHEEETHRTPCQSRVDTSHLAKSYYKLFTGLDIKMVDYECDTANLTFYSGKRLRYVHISPERWALIDGETLVFFAQSSEKYWKYVVKGEGVDSIPICENLSCYRVFRGIRETFDDYELLAIQLSLFHLNKKPFWLDTASVYDSYSISIGKNWKEANDVIEAESDLFHDTLRRDYWMRVFAASITNPLGTYVLTECRVTYKGKKPRG